MNVPQENRPVAFIKVNIKHHPHSVKDIAAWLHKQADYLVEHQTKISNSFTARMFYDPRPRKKK